LLFSAVISQHFSKNRMIISVVATKIWYLKNVRFLLGHPVYIVCRLYGWGGAAGANSHDMKMMYAAYDRLLASWCRLSVSLSVSL